MSNITVVGVCIDYTKNFGPNINMNIFFSCHVCWDNIEYYFINMHIR